MIHDRNIVCQCLLVALASCRTPCETNSYIYDTVYASSRSSGGNTLPKIGLFRILYGLPAARRLRGRCTLPRYFKAAAAECVLLFGLHNFKEGVMFPAQCQ